MQAKEITIEQRDTRVQKLNQKPMSVFVNPNDKLMSVGEVAQAVGVSGPTVYYWVSVGKIKARKVGGTILVFIWSEVREALKGTKYAR